MNPIISFLFTLFELALVLWFIIAGLSI